MGLHCMTQFIREHYLVDHQPVLLIMAPDRYPLQAWVVETATKSLIRDDSHILTIQTDSSAKFLPAAHFEKFCARNAISTNIPEHVIAFTFALVSRTPAKLSNVIPFPTGKNSGTVTKMTDHHDTNGPFLAFA